MDAGYLHLIAFREAAVPVPAGLCIPAGRTFFASPPRVRKSLRLRYGAVTSENGTPGDGSTGRGTGPAPRRAAKRQPAGTLSQPRAADRPRAAKAASADRDQGSALATEPAARSAAADAVGPAATAAGLPAAGARPAAIRAWCAVGYNAGYLPVRDNGPRPGEDCGIPCPGQDGGQCRRERSRTQRSAGHARSHPRAAHSSTQRDAGQNRDHPRAAHSSTQRDAGPRRSRHRGEPGTSRPSRRCDARCCREAGDHRHRNGERRTRDGGRPRCIGGQQAAGGTPGQPNGGRTYGERHVRVACHRHDRGS